MQGLAELVSNQDAQNSAEMSVLLSALIALRDGDASVRLPHNWDGVAGKVADAFNMIADRNEVMTSQLARLSQVVGKEGQLSQRAVVGEMRGFWRRSLDSVNELIDDLVHPISETARVIGAVEQARQALEEKAEQLALTSKYKSEFLANMSHELRTPLNSLLILSDQLSRNGEGNLSPRQVEFARTIHLSGNDLLALINDILDLSKIESGTVAVDISELRLDDLQRAVERGFRHVAEAKQVAFEIVARPPLPTAIVTDAKRLQQIIKNLLSNAFKFTHQGSVSLSVGVVESGWSRDNGDLQRAAQVLAFSVSDTGIGISPDKQQIIFEAFQQADGSTSRKYGGTGLGLAISRELARLLGGEIRLVSVPGQGSTFTLYLPQTLAPTRVARAPRLAEPIDDAGAVAACALDESAEPEQTTLDEAPWSTSGQRPAGGGLRAPNLADDDRGDIVVGDKLLLIVENDLPFARMMLEAARRQGFKGLVSGSGAVALAMTREYQPSVITLDIFLPDMQGWRILERLKADPATRHIPVCVVSTDDSRERALDAGAIAFLTKPLQSVDQVDQAVGQLQRLTERSRKRVLVMMADTPLRSSYLDAVAANTDIVQAQTPAAARAALADGDIDCVVTDGSVAGFGPEDVIEIVDARPLAQQMPIVLAVAGAETSAAAAAPGVTARWERGHRNFALRKADSIDPLLDATAFFLHRGESAMSERERHATHALRNADRPLEHKKVLIVDDDMRNIFALAALLDAQGMQIVSAENGRDAIRLVQDDPAIDIVLMDIMMPEMDGMQTMRQMRQLPRGKELPIIAVTAKAMKGDREKCIEAGAWDYVSKPVDSAQLLVMIRGWLA